MQFCQKYIPLLSNTITAYIKTQEVFAETNDLQNMKDAYKTFQSVMEKISGEGRCKQWLRDTFGLQTDAEIQKWFDENSVEFDGMKIIFPLLGLRDNSLVTNLPDFLEVRGKLIVAGCENLTSLPENLFAQSLYIYDSGIHTFPDGLDIEYGLLIYENEISSVGEFKRLSTVYISEGNDSTIALFEEAKRTQLNLKDLKIEITPKS